MTVLEAAAVTDTEPRQRGAVLRRLIRNPVAVGCTLFLLLVILFGLLAPLLAPYPPGQTNLAAVNAGPFTPGHLLGGDASGRDILSRLMWGTRETLLSCVIILSVALVVGVPAGLIAGYYRGKFEAVTNWVSDVILCMPGLVLLIALYAFTGPNVAAAMAVFGVLVAPSYFRLVRGVVVGVRNELYIDAAKVVGLSDARIVSKHILWSVRAPVIIQSSFVLAAGIAIEAAIDFLGLGNPAQASWGGMLQAAFANLYNNPRAVIWPAVLISLTILALVLLGNALRDELQVSGAPRALTARQHERLERSLRTEAATTEALDGGTTNPEDHDLLLSIRGLRIAYPGQDEKVVEVVHGVDLDVRRGEIVGLVGESGSGKTQTAFAVLGILPKEALNTGGVIRFGDDGSDLLANRSRQSSLRGRQISYVPQEPMSNLDPTFTVGAQLVYGLRAVKSISRQAARKEILGLLSRVGIRDPQRTFRSYPFQISGGMAQRVLICGAVAGNPDLIIADEPTTALDVTIQAEVLDLLRELRDERGIGMLLVTHNLGVVADICDRVSVMKAGRIVESSDVQSIFRAPQNEYTKELLSSTREVDLEEANEQVDLEEVKGDV
jgi:ABC-type dipeptide/oligopeptide/nickel transport system ATPase component/ABC-type dipeptide/oligopeptide/nickel transport system permease subunit